MSRLTGKTIEEGGASAVTKPIEAVLREKWPDMRLVRVPRVERGQAYDGARINQYLENGYTVLADGSSGSSPEDVRMAGGYNMVLMGKDRRAVEAQEAAARAVYTDISDQAKFAGFVANQAAGRSGITAEVSSDAPVNIDDLV